jgi:hypothetical protein
VFSILGVLVWRANMAVVVRRGGLAVRHGDWVCLALFFEAIGVFELKTSKIGFVWRG